jgi:hypothetical protein
VTAHNNCPSRECADAGHRLAAEMRVIPAPPDRWAFADPAAWHAAVIAYGKAVCADLRPKQRKARVRTVFASPDALGADFWADLITREPPDEPDDDPEDFDA